MKFAKFLRTTFLHKSSSGCFWGLAPVFKEVRGKNRYDCQQIPDSAEKKYLLSRKSRSSHRRHSVKEGLQGLQLFPVNIAKFLRTPILKNICKRLFLQISISVTNLLRGGNSWILLPFKPYSILNLCNMFRQGFYVVAFFFSNIFIIKKLFRKHIKWDIIISSSLRLLLKCEFDTDVKVE